MFSLRLTININSKSIPELLKLEIRLILESPFFRTVKHFGSIYASFEDICYASKSYF